MARRRRAAATSPAPGLVAYLPLALVLLALVVVYAPVRRAQFLQWDDFKTIAANPDLNPPSISGVLRYWDPRRPYMDLYVPVTYTAWAAVASLPGSTTAPPSASGPARLDAGPFHTASLAAHAIAAALAFFILRRLLAAHGVPADRAAWSAGIGAGLFALHPLQVESIAWASGLKDVLAGALTLAALWLYLHFARAGLTREASLLAPLPAFSLATLAFLLATLSKPSAVVTPLLAACLALALPVATPATKPQADAGRRAAPMALLAPLALWCLLAVPIMLIARRAQPAASGFTSPLWARPLVALDALAFYAVKFVAPIRLAMDYGRSPDWLASTPWIWCAWIVPAAIGAAVFLARKRAPWLVPSALLSVAALLTVLGLLRFDFQSHSTVADHYVYVALLGPAIALAFALSRRRVGETALIGGLILLPLAALARFQVPVWHDTTSLFTHTLEVNPASVAANINLGHLLYAQGRTEEAARHDEAALATRPDEPEAHNNLGNALRRLKRPAEAADHYRAALAVQPGSASGHFNLGLALFDLGDLAGAAHEYDEALRLEPDYAVALANRAELYLMAGDFEKAAAGYRRAIDVNPTLGAARRGLASALAGQAGRRGGAADATEPDQQGSADP